MSTRAVSIALVRAAVVSSALTAACVNSFTRPVPQTVGRPPEAASRPGPDSTIVLAWPVKAHLLDGTTVVFRGAVVTHRAVAALDTLLGQAWAPGSPSWRPVRSVPFDSLVGLEVYTDEMLVGQTVVATAAATTVAAVAAVGLAKALFGSCPTVYADTGAAGVLQAEGFSYAIAPLLEHRDLDALRVRAGPDGVIRLELRNEALETHYINHVELVAVRHDQGSVVVPDQRALPVVVGARRPPVRAVDRAGRDVRADLASADARLYSTDTARLTRADALDPEDWIDLTADSLPPGDSVAVVLRLRNSLLNTVLLYDGMLSGRAAATWLGADLRQAATAVALANWYRATMGMRIALLDAAGNEVAGSRARLPDVGPLAFRDVAVLLPRLEPDADRVRVRLRFVADNWRIDRAEFAAVAWTPEAVPVPLTGVVVPAPAHGAGPLADSAALGALARVDTRRLQTRPGQRLVLEFRAPADSARGTITYLLAWQGWYSEWIRGAWLAADRAGTFEPGAPAVAEALARWRQGREALERQFYATRIPVR